MSCICKLTLGVILWWSSYSGGRTTDALLEFVNTEAGTLFSGSLLDCTL